jgi:ATP-dependent RNA helicase UAP56/SUB2
MFKILNNVSYIDMRRDVQGIFTKTKPQKQTMMFSATMSKEVTALIRKFLQDPVEVIIDSDKNLTLHGLKQYYVNLTPSTKNRRLTSLLSTLKFNQLLIFVSTAHRAKALHFLLTSHGYACNYLTSKMPMKKREAIYKKFKEGTVKVLVATDLLGRGVDVEKVNVVINYDMPRGGDEYLHRVGRAGRFGTKGLAVSFIEEKEKKVMEDIQGRFELKVEEMGKQVDEALYTNN